MSPDFTATRMGRALQAGLPCQAPSEGGPRPRASPEGPCGAGIGQWRGCRDRIVGGARIPLSENNLLLHASASA